MLVLNRDISGTITLGDNIKITVIETQGNHTRLVMDAPKEVTVLRGGVFTRTQNEKSCDKEAP